VSSWSTDVRTANCAACRNEMRGNCKVNGVVYTFCDRRFPKNATQEQIDEIDEKSKRILRAGKVAFKLQIPVNEVLPTDVLVEDVVEVPAPVVQENENRQSETRRASQPKTRPPVASKTKIVEEEKPDVRPRPTPVKSKTKSVVEDIVEEYPPVDPKVGIEYDLQGVALTGPQAKSRRRKSPVESESSLDSSVGPSLTLRIPPIGQSPKSSSRSVRSNAAPVYEISHPKKRVSAAAASVESLGQILAELQGLRSDLQGILGTSSRSRKGKEVAQGERPNKRRREDR